jgi:hypothetical protein
MKILARSVYCAAVTLVLAHGPAHGQSGTRDSVQLPGTGYEVTLEPASSQGATPPSPALIEGIGTWLSLRFDLPEAPQQPAVRFIAPEAMLALRHRGIASDHGLAVAGMRDMLAVYDDDRRTIYLREDWRGDSAAGLSIVVHEMVHHMQNAAGLTFACPEAREDQAFAAQQEWLALFGKDLATEFDLDPFTLLVRTNCSL